MNLEFKGFLVEAGIEESKISKLLGYYSMVLRENEKQNLTRIVHPRDFFEKNIVDCLNLLKGSYLSEKNLDLGSGFGVPGLVCGILDLSKSWILCESEKSKAAFIEKALDSLELDNIKVIHGRIETVIEGLDVTTVVSRAVGSVGKLISWIDGSSTWNNLVLFKASKWDEEWKEFIRLKENKEIFLAPETYLYSDDGSDSRKIINLVRNVPRRTL